MIFHIFLLDSYESCATSPTGPVRGVTSFVQILPYLTFSLLKFVQKPVILPFSPPDVIRSVQTVNGNLISPRVNVSVLRNGRYHFHSGVLDGLSTLWKNKKYHYENSLNKKIEIVESQIYQPQMFRRFTRGFWLNDSVSNMNCL